MCTQEPYAGHMSETQNHTHFIYTIRVEYHANYNPLKISEKIAYVGQQLMYPISKKIYSLYQFRFLH